MEKKIENLMTFNFVLDAIKDEEIREKYENLSPYDKYFFYRILNKSDKDFKVTFKTEDNKKAFESYIDSAIEYHLPDPDSGGSSLLQDILKKVGNKNPDNYALCESGKYIYSDTMNSTQDIMSRLVEIYVEERKEVIPDIFSNKPKITRLACIAIAANKGKDFYNWLDTVPKLKEYLELYHTIGNHIPVPHGFNSGRGCVTKDYWDITLLYIYKYYNDNNAEHLEGIFGTTEKAKEAKEECIKWLNSFGGWDEFVEANFLTSFVDEKKYPKELWAGHFQQNTWAVQNKEQCVEFLENVTRMISARGENIVKFLEHAK